MNAIRKHLRFSNVVACLALFAALGGSAYAANKIGTNQIKNNAVTTAKIKNNAVTTKKIKNSQVTTAKIKNGAVTGSKVNVATLGTVPTATAADSAGVAGVAGSLDGQESVFLKLNGGQSATIIELGSVSITAECVKNDGGYDYIKTYGQTSQNGAILAADDSWSGGSNPGDFLNTDTPKDDREFEVASAPTGLTFVAKEIDSGFVMGPDGSMVSTNSEGMALGLNYLGADCIVAGVFNSLSQ